MLPGTSWPERWKRNIFIWDTRGERIAKRILMVLNWLYFERRPRRCPCGLGGTKEEVAQHNYLYWKKAWKIKRKMRWQLRTEKFWGLISDKMWAMLHDDRSCEQILHDAEMRTKGGVNDTSHITHQ